MPANFPTADQKRHYGRFAEEPSPEQLGAYFHLADTDRRLIYSCNHDHTQLGMAVQIGSTRFLGLFLPKSQWAAVPGNSVQYVAAQLGLDSIQWPEYLSHKQTVYDHQALIRQHYGYRDCTDPAVQFSTVRWLYTRVWLHDEPPSRLFDLLVHRLKERKVLLPGISALERLINHIREQASKRIWIRINRQLTETQRQQLQTLVTTENREQSVLDRLRDGPTTISPDALKSALARIKALRQIGVSDLDVSWLAAPDRFKKLARRAALSKAYHVDRLDAPRKWATLAAFVHVYESRAIDDALDLFDKLMQTRLTRAGQQGERKRIRTLRDLDIAARRLAKAGNLLLSLNPHESVYLNEVLFSVIPQEQFATAVTQVDTLTRLPDDNYYEILLNHYNQFRRFLSSFWYTLEFDGLESEGDLLAAISFLKGLEPLNLPSLKKADKQQIVDEAPQKIITAVWKPYVIGEEGHIHLHYYTFCVLLQLRDALRRRSIFAAGSERWGDLRDKLLSETAWRKVKTQVCRSLGHPTTPETVLETLEKQLDAAYRQVADNLPENTKVRLETVADKTRFILEPLEGLAEPASLVLTGRWPTTCRRIQKSGWKPSPTKHASSSNR